MKSFKYLHHLLAHKKVSQEKVTLLHVIHVILEIAFLIIFLRNLEINDIFCRWSTALSLAIGINVYVWIQTWRISALRNPRNAAYIEILRKIWMHSDVNIWKQWFECSSKSLNSFSHSSKVSKNKHRAINEKISVTSRSHKKIIIKKIYLQYYTCSLK